MTHFNHRPYVVGETVAAIATPPGEGGVAIIRISGDQAISIVEKVYKGPIRSYKSHTMHLGAILSQDGSLIDEVMAVVMKAPKSYTGEETVEIHCHGGSLISKSVLERILEVGARAALPGEFTFKAYMNGKIDLAQAEAVQTLISAKNTLALHAAENQLQGKLSQAIEQFQTRLFDIAAILEAWVDFPEEGLEFASFEEVTSSLEEIKKDMQRLAQTFEEGRVLEEGIKLCLSGVPNVGKSSLMNALLGKERAIVTEIAGTTRDLLDADLKLGGLHFQLMDTAGIREAEERIEQEGIRRSIEAFQESDIILIVLDATQGIREEDADILRQMDLEKTVVIWNKIDLPSSHTQPLGSIGISAKERTGIDLLKEAILAKIWKRGAPSKDEIVITSLRHKQSLEQATGYLTQVIEGFKGGVSPEFLSADMRSTLLELGTIIGKDMTEEILSAIFSKFCVGK
ncbi:tRNA uridine-5-carboxymethylaminomethyl(34) synthesis GTPase MnmE [Rhabdochlamydiaceae symbiont of Dictyostelium giganteum]|uniref:tRNA uridine-5-carboxymethylaminomethyl(34) synthesis GTPase MnmE n=1 Tax=Rhabdochlamydiaceae symbiont of Dictyostelium giganteum TaxID=3342349 RepID=UPI00384E3231